MGAALVTIVERHYIGIPMGDKKIPEDWSLPFTDTHGKTWPSFKDFVDYFHYDSVRNDGGAHLVSREIVKIDYQP